MNSTPSKITTIGGLGAITGTVLNREKPWQGTVIDGAIGALGGNMLEQSDNERDYQRQQSLPRTDCQKVRVIKQDKGCVISDTIEEVCRGNQTTYSY